MSFPLSLSIYIYMKFQGMLNAFNEDFIISHIKMKEQIILNTLHTLSQCNILLN